MDNNATQEITASPNGISHLSDSERPADRGRTVASVSKLGRTSIAGLVPQTLDDVYRLATAIAKSGLAPQQLKTPEAITVAILTGLELGLPPMFALNKIAVINGRPTLWGDAVPGILWSHGFKLREWRDGDTAHCEVTRPGGDIIARSFSISDAKTAKLWGKAGPWQMFPDRMLAMRARSFAARDGAADVLGGLYVAEEIDGGTLQEVGNSSAFARKSSAEGKRDGSVKIFNGILAAIKSSGTQEDLLAIRMEHLDADMGTPWANMPRAWAETIEQDFQLRASDLGLDIGDDH
jgi:hypothetical protein